MKQALVIIFTIFATIMVNAGCLYWITKEDSTCSSQPIKCKATLKNHSAYGPAKVNNTVITNITKIYGPFSSENSEFKEMTIFGPLALKETKVMDAIVYGPVNLDNSVVLKKIKVFGSLMAKKSKIKQLDVTANHIFIEQCTIKSIKISSDPQADSDKQTVYLNGKSQIDEIIFESGRGEIFVSGNKADAEKIKIRGAVVRFKNNSSI